MRRQRPGAIEVLNFTFAILAKSPSCALGPPKMLSCSWPLLCTMPMMNLVSDANALRSFVRVSFACANLFAIYQLGFKPQFATHRSN